MWKNTTWNILGLVVPSLIAIPSMAFMARILEVEKFGLFMLAFSLLGYAGVFDGGLTRAVIRAIAINDGDIEKDRVVIGTASWAVFALSCVASPLLYIFSDNLIGLLNVSDASIDDAGTAFKYLAFAIPPFLLSLIWFAYPEGTQNFLILNIYKTVSGTVIAALPVLALVYEPTLTSAIKGMLAGRIISLGLAFIPCAKSFKRNFFGFQWQALKKLLAFGGWITFSNIISPLMVYADRFILSNIVGAQVVAFYTAPSEAIARMSIIPGAVSRTIFPLFSKLQNRSSSVASQAFKGLLIVSILMAVPVFIFAESIINLWLGAAYGKESSTILRILLVGFLFNSMAQIPFSQIQAHGHARITAMIHISELLPYVGILFALVYFYGLTGAAIAWSLRVAADFFILSHYARKLKF
jgi:O-antigen/teichoic acid export membrane protein